jgi:hypothetical protein
MRVVDLFRVLPIAVVVTTAGAGSDEADRHVDPETYPEPTVISVVDGSSTTSAVEVWDGTRIYVG